MAKTLLSYRLRPSDLRVTVAVIATAGLLALLLLPTFRHSRVLGPSHLPMVFPMLAESHDNASRSSQALIMAKTVKEDINWLFEDGFSVDYSLFVYTMSTPQEPGYLIPRTNRGREAAAFISYILDYYDALPAYSIFIHANNKQKHNDLFGPLNSHLLPHLRKPAIDAAGYVNLRCNTDPGCPIAINPHEPTEQDKAVKLDPRANFVNIYSDLFDVPAAGVPRHIENVCCAQFAVSRARILQRPKQEYEGMMNWIANSTQTDNFGVGWVFEKLWHVVFGMEATLCPRYEQCRCDLYGWCGPLASGELLQPSDMK